MKLTLWAIGALLAVPACAMAQQAPRAADPADPRAAVPPAVYESALPATPHPSPEHGDATPDKLWRSANDKVAGAPGHAGHGSGAAPANGHAHAAKPVHPPAAGHSKHH